MVPIKQRKNRNRKFHLFPFNDGFSFRFSMSDRLDVSERTSPTLNDPLGIKSSGMKNKDSYSFFALFLTYDLMPKYRKCNN